MITFAPYFKMYSDYLNNYNKADELIVILKIKNKR